MSIMNMPPLTYLKRIPGLDTDPLEFAYTDSSVWRSFDPAFMTLGSPDPQAFRPPDQPVNVLQVTLPTNFKVARFEIDKHTQMLRDMQTGIEADPLGGWPREDRAPGQAQGARQRVRSACQMGHAAYRKLWLNHQGRAAQLS